MEQPFTLALNDPGLLRQAMLIDGKWIQADSGATIEVRNPATGALIARVPKAGAIEQGQAPGQRPLIDCAAALWTVGARH